jgi:PPK2 family polyphosphate:nucleotide phosphotransferase
VGRPELESVNDRWRSSIRHLAESSRATSAHGDPTAPLVADFARYRVDPEEGFRLSDSDTTDTDDLTREQARAELAGLTERIAGLQARLYAEEQRGVLVVLQGIDAAGKDSTVKHVFSGSNPQGVRVYTFKEPTDEEAAHDFLWRYHQDAPARGMIHVFNRSHYEDVLVVRVKGLTEEARWRSRYDSINDFERMLARERTVIVKFFLHISKDAQLDRFRERLERPDKHYKFSANDVRERRNWDAYQEAYEDAVNFTSTPWAPWFVVPSDHKWYRNLVVARILCTTLEAMNPEWPAADADLGDLDLA